MRISDWSSDVCSSDLDRTEVPMTDDEQARVAALEAESEALCEQWSEVPDVPAEVHARIDAIDAELGALVDRSEEHTSELQSLMRISYAVFCLKKKKKKRSTSTHCTKLN